MVVRMLNEEIKLGDNNYVINGSFLVAMDKAYGADADGNRGVAGVWVYDYDIDEIIRNDENHTMTDKEIDNLLTYIEENIEKFE